MIVDKNVRLLREGYRLWNESKASSVAHWMSMIADDVKWSSLADGATGLEFSRACGSKKEVARYFEELGREWELLHYTVGEFIAQGDRVVAIGSCAWKNRRTGNVLETPKADIIRMKDSKIVEFFEFFDTAKAMAASQ